jgi:SAM-dependent methyltransferase
MNKIKAVRCGSKKATPYLRQHIDLFTEYAGGHVVDLACGNGRNSEYMKEKGMHVMSLDANNDYGIRWEAGMPVPVGNKEVDYILCNYLLMFLDDHARNDVYDEMLRISHVGTRVMIELEEVKQSLTPDYFSLCALNDEVNANMIARGFRSIHGRQNHYIFERIV